MRAWFLMLARFCVSAWVGAAVLFVVVAVREVRHPSFDSQIRDHLALVRFPAYYAFGFTLTGLGLLGSLAATGHRAVGRRRGVAATVFVALALISLAIDYHFVYRPLTEMTTPPGGTKPAEFTTYHRLSMWVNGAGLLTCLVAAGLLNWPGKAEGLQPLGSGRDDVTRPGGTGV